MAKPRIFVSSTFYDLRHVRGEIERFIKEMGYEPVLNEYGHIPYESKEKLEQYCYKEIEKIHILVSIIGNRFGSQASESPDHSISNLELQTAIKQGKQVYIFIDSGVYNEYRTYLKNKANKSIQYSHVDDIRIFEFIEKLYDLSSNNQIKSFENIPQILYYLKEQWAGLFEIYLQQQEREQIVRLADILKSSADTLAKLIELSLENKSDAENTIKEQVSVINQVALQYHPIFLRFQHIFRIRFRLYFTTVREMELFLEYRGYEPVVKEEWDSPDEFEYITNSRPRSAQMLLYVSRSLFDDLGNLRPIFPDAFSDRMVRLKKHEISPQTKPDLDDDIPF